MKLSRKLIPAFAMLLVSAIMLTTASYAWFSINTTVSAQGMSVKTTSSDSVLIAATLVNNGDVKTDDAFGTALVQSVSGILAPVSTVDGVNYYVTAGDNVKGNGDAKNEVYTSTTTGLSAVYGDGVEAYVDYAFQIKATNAGAAIKNLNIKNLELAYTVDDVAAYDNAQKAFRVAIFVEKLGDGATFSTGVGTLKSVLAPTGAAYFTSNSAVAGVDSLDTVGALNTAATLDAVAAGTTNYYKVVVRLWLEGEDTTCTNDTFATLSSGDFALTLDVQLEAASAVGVSAITTVAAAPDAD